MNVLRALFVALLIAIPIDADAGEVPADASGDVDGLGGLNWDAIGKVSFANGNYSWEPWFQARSL